MCPVCRFANISQEEEQDGWGDEAGEKQKKKQQATKKTQREKNHVKKHRSQPTKTKNTKHI